MGFSISGIKPRSKQGKHFDRNVWGWRPIWEYVCAECSDILTDKDKEEGHRNNFYEISKSKAVKIADKLDLLIKSRHAGKYASEVPRPVESMLDMPYSCSVRDIKEFAEFCRKSGGFRIA